HHQCRDRPAVYVRGPLRADRSPYRLQRGRRNCDPRGGEGTLADSVQAPIRRLVALHRGFDQLVWRWASGGLGLGLDEDCDAARGAGVLVNQAGAFESKHHLVERRRGDTEGALQTGFGWGTAEDQRIGVDEGGILALLGREPRWGKRG